jgi:hypothetical protein
VAVRTSYPVFFMRNCNESTMFGSSSTISTLGGLLMAITGFDVPVLPCAAEGPARGPEAQG